MIKIREGVRPPPEGQVRAEIGEIRPHFFQTDNEIILPTTNLEEHYEYDVIEDFEHKVTGFEIRDSGWAIHRILYLDVTINRYEPLRGESYIPLPKELTNKSQ